MIDKMQQRVQETLQKYKYDAIDSVEELRHDGSTRLHVWVNVDVDGEYKLFNIQSDFNVFYDSDFERMKKDIAFIQKNNKSITAMLKNKSKRDAENDVLDRWLKETFGDDLPARKTIATIRKYLADDVLKEYANGKKGINGVRAQAAFFNTKAYVKFYNAVK